MAYYVTADTHFGHANIIRYCGRPFSSAEEMNETLVINWNEVVGPDDVVLHLGDVAFGASGLACVSRCRGRKILIRGNHDKGHSRTALIRAGFEDVFGRDFDNPFIFFSTHDPVGRQKVVLSHHPDPMVRSDLPCLCGHVHEKWDFLDGWLNVGVDAWGFRPVLLSYAIQTWHTAQRLGVRYGI